MVLRAKRAKNGRMMYFKDNKLISKSKFLAARSRSKTRKSRSPARKASNGSKKMARRTIPHPSVTGMASGLAIASYLNAGKTVSGKFVTTTTDGVLKDITDGELGKALMTLSGNAVDMIGSDTGRKTLVGASVVALAGAFARRQFPNLKLGGSKLYFRV